MTHHSLYFLRELIINLTRNLMMSVAAASTSTISLITLGISLIMVFNMNNLSAELTDQLVIRAFLNDSVTNLDIKNLQENIHEMREVLRSRYISPDEALDILEGDLNIDLDITPEENPLPHSLEIKVSDSRYVGVVADRVRDLPGVQEVKYGETVLQGILKVSMLIKTISYILTILMGAGALFTIMNTIRLTVIARRDEIRTMQLVGATQWFIRWPFLLEGVALGVIGAFLAATALSISYSIMGTSIDHSIQFLFKTVEGPVMARILYSILIIVGTIMGFAGSYISLSRFLAEQK